MRAPSHRSAKAFEIGLRLTSTLNAQTHVPNLLCNSSHTIRSIRIYFVPKCLRASSRASFLFAFWPIHAHNVFAVSIHLMEKLVFLKFATIDALARTST